MRVGLDQAELPGGVSVAEVARPAGVFTSVPALLDAIEAYLAVHNQGPQPLQWTETTDQILAKVRRVRVTLNAITT